MGTASVLGIGWGPGMGQEGEEWGWRGGPQRYLLNVFGPRRRFMLGHEHTVGQDGTHDQHAEERGTGVKEAIGGPTGKALGGLTHKG